ncbi:PREDICTED: tripartite motif-containing protein 10-like, partial [Fulmarus glacialis]|uniref:tripartite motif-containing protein 10-like n=1 Tax=Fulmarus glacialis TaxID=30455 RepID=UPI00051AC33A
GKVASERQRLRDTFKELQQFLREQEGVLLAQLDQAHGELTKERRKYVSSVSERKSLLDTLIAEIEKKRDQPVVEFLTDVGKTLSRYETGSASLSSRTALLGRDLEMLQAAEQQPLGGRRVCPACCEVAKAPIPEPVSPELRRTVNSLSEMSQLVVGAVARFKGKAKKR